MAGQEKPSPLRLKIGQQSQKLVNTISHKLNTAGDHTFVHNFTRGLKTNDDDGKDFQAKALAAGAEAAKGGIAVFNTAQTMSPYVVKGAVKVGKGAYLVGKTSVKVVRSAVKTGVGIKTGAVTINRNVLATAAIKHQLRFAVATASVTSRAKYAVLKTAQGASYRVRKTVNNAKATVATVVWIAGGASGNSRYIVASLSKDALKNMGKTLATNSVKLAKMTPRFAKDAWKITKFNAKTVGNVVKIGVPAISGALLKSDDAGVRSLGMGVKSIELSARGTARGFKAVKTTAKGGVKTVKTIKRGVKSLKTLGLKKSAKKLAGKTVKAIAKAALNLARFALQKLLIPILVIAVGVTMLMAGVSAPVSAVASIFGGVFSIFEPKDDGTGEYTDFETDAFLREIVTRKRAEFAKKVADEASQNLTSGGGEYHYVRLFSQEESDPLAEVRTEASTEELEAAALLSLESVSNLADILNPLFTVIILEKYDLSPTEAQANAVVDELWDTIMTTTTETLPIEYCGGLFVGDPINDEACGAYTAWEDCPNIETVTHGSYVCGMCDHEHPETHSDGRGNSWTEWVFDGCDGCHHCLGHNILKLQINQDGYFALLNKYFENPIEELSSKPSLTDDEKEELQNLQDNYEICLDLINEIQGNKTDGTGSVDLSGVEFVDGTRAGNLRIIELAKSHLGEVGGRTFWGGLGYGSRIEWCAAFVSWCARELHYTPSAYTVFVSCRVGIAEFQSKGQWYAGSYSDPAPGDLIFFDWDSDGRADHVGFVAGTDGERVYTVEGNSGDAVRARSYPLNSSVIFGYGLPNY